MNLVWADKDCTVRGVYKYFTEHCAQLVHNQGWNQGEVTMNFQKLAGGLILMAAASTWAGGDTAVDTAIEDLATRIKVSAEAITVVSQSEVTWPDRGLGCPRKGMMYAQVLTNGSELILEAGGKRYAYHSGGGKPYFYCAVPAKKSGTPSGTPRHDI